MWSETSPMRERVRFVVDVDRRDLPVVELCERYGVSRKTAYKWLGRYRADGPAGLEDRSRRPEHSPNATDPVVVALLEELRRRHPTWGAGKLLKVLGRREPELHLPARSTGCELLKRAGLVLQSRRRLRRGHPGPPLSVMDEPNAVWCADFKGQFKTRDGVYCYPLTVTDGFSRCLLCCQGLRCTRHELVKPLFTRLFHEYGLPWIIRTDNGAPFASTALGRLSHLSVWWIRLGIHPELTEPASPAQNGRHERMHKTLKAETARPPAGSLAAQQVRFNAFRREFNEERPHEALGKRRRRRSMSDRRGSFLRNCRRSSTPGTTNFATSAKTGRFAGERPGSALRPCWRTSTSASKKSATDSGTYTSAVSDWDVSTRGGCRSKIRTDAGHGGIRYPCPRTNPSPMSPTEHSLIQCFA